jgi:Peptidase family M20/M25/M40
VNAAIDRDFDDHLERVRDFLRIPSISAHDGDLRSTAAAVVELIEAAGGAAEIAEPGEKRPTVIGVHRRAGPTVLRYGMYDVQPPGAGWSRDPFAAEVEDGRIYARGAANSKAALAGSLLAFAGADSPSRQVLLMDGEEELGSPRLARFCEQHRDTLLHLGAAPRSGSCRSRPTRRRRSRRAARRSARPSRAACTCAPPAAARPRRAAWRGRQPRPGRRAAASRRTRPRRRGRERTGRGARRRHPRARARHRSRGGAAGSPRVPSPATARRPRRARGWGSNRHDFPLGRAARPAFRGKKCRLEPPPSMPADSPTRSEGGPFRCA